MGKIRSRQTGRCEMKARNRLFLEYIPAFTLIDVNVDICDSIEVSQLHFSDKVVDDENFRFLLEEVSNFIFLQTKHPTNSTN